MLLGALVATAALQDINKGKGLNRDQYDGVFNTDETDPAKFWDSLNKGKYWMLGKRRMYHAKTSVGALAVDQGFMTPSMGWNTSNTKYADLKPKQQRIIKAALKCKDEPYSVLPIRGLMGNLFRVN